jgi:transcriptional regulator with XRE-family HTH domain
MVNVSNLTESCPVSCLADYVRSVRNKKNLSLAEVSARSRGRISKTHINRIENGTVTRVSLQKLGALSRGLDVPESELIAAAQGTLPRVEPPASEAELLEYFHQLSRDRQKDVLFILRTLVQRFPANDEHRGGAV